MIGQCVFTSQWSLGSVDFDYWTFLYSIYDFWRRNAFTLVSFRFLWYQNMHIRYELNIYETDSDCRSSKILIIVKQCVQHVLVKAINPDQFVSSPIGRKKTHLKEFLQKQLQWKKQKRFNRSTLLTYIMQKVYITRACEKLHPCSLGTSSSSTCQIQVGVNR